MLQEKDLLQIKNLIISYYKNSGYFPFFEDLYKKYSFLFPENINEKTKDQIDELVNELIIEKIESKKTKGGLIMLKILQNNQEEWKQFRKLNSLRFFDEEKFQNLGKKIETLIENGETKLTEKLVGAKSMGIAKTSESWYDMVYAIFPLWNKIK